MYASHYQFGLRFVQIQQQLQHATNSWENITPMNQLLITLRFYATGTFQVVIGDTFAVHKSTACSIVHRVTAAIAGLRDKYVSFPNNVRDRRNVMNQFYSVAGLPGVIGAIDCTHVPIQSPGGDQAEIFRNRKGYFSINVQLISDQRGYVMDVVARWPGSVHDSTILDNSRIRAILETSPLDGYLIGDGGYPCRRYLLTPLSNPATEAQLRYNTAHAATRNCIERANGILKRRFPCLKYGMRLKLENILPVIVATVVLNNIALIAGDDTPEDDEELSDFLDRRRQQNLQVEYDPVEVGPPPAPVGIANTAIRQAVIDNHFN